MGIMSISIMTIICVTFPCIMTIIIQREINMGEFNQSQYINEFIKEKYDTFKVQVPKGQKAIIEEHWRAKGYKSLNAYVNELIQRDMQATGEDGKQVNSCRRQPCQARGLPPAVP